MLSVLRELKDALSQDRVPDIKNAFDMDRIKNDLPMWGALMGSMFAVTVIFLMLTLPVIGISVVFGGEFEWLVILLMALIFGLQFLASFSTAVLLFWFWIYLSEGLSPIDTIKPQFFMKSTIVQVIVHMLIVYADDDRHGLPGSAFGPHCRYILKFRRHIGEFKNHR